MQRPSKQTVSGRRSGSPFAYLVAIFLLASGTGCEERVLEGPPPADHGESPDPAEDPLGAQLHAFGLRRAPAFMPQPEIFRGELERGRVMTHPLVLVGTRCYAIAAVGDDNVEDLDVTLIDANGSPVMRDEAASNETILGMRTSLCPTNPGEYRFRVRVRRGEGAYVARLYAIDML